MNKSILAVTLALGLSAGLAAAARADQTTPAPSASSQQGDSSPQREQSAALWDYDHSVNPTVNVGTTGPYDEEDLHRDATGRPLPGYAQMFGGGDGN